MSESPNYLPVVLNEAQRERASSLLAAFEGALAKFDEDLGALPAPKARFIRGSLANSQPGVQNPALRLQLRGQYSDFDQSLRHLGSLLKQVPRLYPEWLSGCLDVLRERIAARIYPFTVPRAGAGSDVHRVGQVAETLPAYRILDLHIQRSGYNTIGGSPESIVPHARKVVAELRQILEGRCPFEWDFPEEVRR